MAILGNIQTAITNFVNEALEASLTNSNLERALQTCLNDMANEDCLIWQVTDQTLSAGDLNLVYPTDYKSLISIVLINSSSVRQAALKPLPQGYKEYLDLRDNDTQTSEPEWYAEHRQRFYLWRPPNASFTTEIDFYRYHPQTPNNILFWEEFRNCIYFGTTYWYANLHKRISDRDHWGPIYYNELDKRRPSIPQTPRIVRG